MNGFTDERHGGGGKLLPTLFACMNERGMLLNNHQIYMLYMVDS